MKNWQAILIAGAMIAAAVIIRFDVDPVRPAHAGIFNEQVSNCILDAAKGGVGLGAGADLLRSACESLYPGG